MRVISLERRVGPSWGTSDRQTSGHSSATVSPRRYPATHAGRTRISRLRAHCGSSATFHAQGSSPESISRSTLSSFTSSKAMTPRTGSNGLEGRCGVTPGAEDARKTPNPTARSACPPALFVLSVRMFRFMLVGVAAERESKHRTCDAFNPLFRPREALRCAAPRAMSLGRSCWKLRCEPGGPRNRRPPGRVHDKKLRLKDSRPSRARVRSWTCLHPHGLAACRRHPSQPSRFPRNTGLGGGAGFYRRRSHIIPRLFRGQP